MAKIICLPKNLADNFLQAIRDGKIKPSELKMLESSEARREFFKQFVGEENAKFVNTRFERALVKKQSNAMKVWVEQVTGKKFKNGALVDATPREKGIVARINKMEDVLVPDEHSPYLKDLVEDKLGLNISEQEAGKLLKLSKKVKELEANRYLGDKEQVDYGMAVMDMTDYMQEISVKDIVKAQGLAEKAGKAFTFTGGMMKAARATWDASAPLRQGRKQLGTKEWIKAFGNMVKFAVDKNAYREFQARIIGHPRYDLMKKSKLALTAIEDKITLREEQFANQQFAKSPFGKLLNINMSERMYAGFLTDLRVQKFNNILDGYEKQGRKLSEKEITDLARVINSGTGRGDLHGFEKVAGELGQAMFSPRYAKSTIDLFNPHFYATNSAVANKEAVKDLVRLTATSASIMGLAAMAGADIELDPRSSDFGKIKVGDTRISVLGGLEIPIRVIAQFSSTSYKSTSTGEIKELNTGEFGSRNRLNVISDFITNKQSPFLSLITDIIQGENFDGKSLGIKDERDRENLVKHISTNLIPLIFETMAETIKEEGGVTGDSLGKIGLVTAAEFFGASASTRGMQVDLEIQLGTRNMGKDGFSWIAEPQVPNKIAREYNALSKEGFRPATASPEGLKDVKEFKSKVSNKRYNEFLDEYGKKYIEEIEKIMNTSYYSNLNPDQKKRIIDRQKDSIVKSVLFNFRML